MKFKTAVILIIVFAMGAVLSAQQSRSLFADRRAQNVGDIVTILVMEASQAQSQANTKTEKKNDQGVMAFGGAGNQVYSPNYGLRGNVNNNFSGNARVERSGQVTTRITANIVETLPGGNLVIQGSRSLTLNGEKETTTITGVVRPEDISWSNTVYSYQMSDVTLGYDGKGVVKTGNRPGLITRLINWIF